MQTFRFAKDIAKFTDIRVIAISGGDPIEAQFEALASRPDVIIATPGRLMHHLREISTFKLKHVQYLVFDEADRLFEMGVSASCYCMYYCDYITLLIPQRFK
jgi:ATP-dependent RNA helicase DDX54/DBP10